MSRSRTSSLLLTAGGLLLILVALYFLTHRRLPSPPAAPVAVTGDEPPLRRVLSAPSAPAPDGENLAQAATVADLAQKLSTRLNHRAVRAREAVLLFKTEEGYRAFLARAAQTGTLVVARIDPLRALRVRVRAYDTFAAELLARASDYGGVSANAFVEIPPVPEERVADRQFAVGDHLLAVLGVPSETDTTAWGRGVTVAVLDGGASPDPALGARLRYLDIGLGYAGTGEDGLHGTAVAVLAAGSAPDARGVAPAASILSIRVLDTEDRSDVFTVAQGIVAAVDADARVVNLSLGGYATSEVLVRAVAYADDRGAVVVAGAGNNGAGRLIWPAADPRVVSVGATDATGRQTSFSNSGPQLALTAPGLGIRTAGLNNTRILFSGTSASAPVVSGALAVLLSLDSSLTPAQAVQILQTHADDGGAAGVDPDYGSGVLNLGWALARNDPARVDAAISGHHYNAGTASLEIVVQNRGSRAAANLTLAVTLNGKDTTHVLFPLPAGRSTVVSLPIDAATAAGPITLRTRLDWPEGVVDAVPANNVRASVLDLAGR